MRRLLFIAGLAVVTTMAAPTVALTSGSPRGSNSPNTFGRCTAANNGEKNGWSNQANGVPQPFQNLANQGESTESSSDSETGTDPRSDVLQACASDGITPGGQGHGAP
jgi:hypothetical protein